MPNPKHAKHGLSRREFMVSAGLAAAFPGLAHARVVASGDGPREDLALHYDKPADAWVEALPVGNGRVGAMVFGRVAQERLQLNEDSLYSGSPYDANNPAMAAALPRIRSLIAQGRYKDAQALADSDMIARPRRQMAYSTAGDLLLDFAGLSAPAGYKRVLNLDTAVSSTLMRIGQANHVRESFVSVPDQVLVLRLTADGGKLDFDLGYRHPGTAVYAAPSSAARATPDQVPGAPWDRREELNREQRPDMLSIRPDGAGALLIEGSNQAAETIPAGLRYAIRVKLVGDGSITPAGDQIQVRNATQVTLLIALATSYVDYTNAGGDAVGTVRTQTEAAARKSYAALKTDHVAAHRALFRKLSIRLGDGRPVQRTTVERIATVNDAPDPGLAALYVQYARYLLMSSSRAGSQPANLQGIWNEGTNPPWGSKFTININTEMNYWPAGPANLSPCVEPLVRMVEDLAVTGARTAREGYGARGWVAHHNTDLWRNTAPVDGAKSGIWPTGGAWLCMSLWNHYEYHPDPAYLKRIYPLLKGASQFFLDTLVEDAQGRGLVTSPSISPENNHHPAVAICAGPAMDRQILRDLFARTLKAQALLGGADADAAFARKLAAARARLPADRIGAQGQLQEWLDDWDAEAPEQTHRHVSHLYGVYPSEQINVRDTPELIAAAKTSLNRRGDKSTGWATAWRLALWARMGDGERAHAILLGLLGPERTYPNMFDAHPPFQIDGNFGGTAGMLEMLLQSWGGEIRLLPALPAAWPDGALHGVRAKGNIEVDIEWKAGRLTRAELRGDAGSQAVVRYRDQLRTLTLDSKGRARWL
jgi:alpha-L-fucosidase 2